MYRHQIQEANFTKFINIKYQWEQGMLTKVYTKSKLLMKSIIEKVCISTLK